MNNPSEAFHMFILATENLISSQYFHITKAFVSHDHSHHLYFLSYSVGTPEPLEYTGNLYIFKGETEGN